MYKTIEDVPRPVRTHIAHAVLNHGDKLSIAEVAMIFQVQPAWVQQFIQESTADEIDPASADFPEDLDDYAWVTQYPPQPTEKKQ